MKCCFGLSTASETVIIRIKRDSLSLEKRRGTETPGTVVAKTFCHITQLNSRKWLDVITETRASASARNSNSKSVLEKAFMA
jgi:hypothetical protein